MSHVGWPLLVGVLAMTGCAGETGASGPDGGERDGSTGTGTGTGETCATAIDVSAGGAFTGSTLDAPNQYQTCGVGGVGVGARVYTLQSTVATRFVVEASAAASTPAFTNLSLAVKRDCAQEFVCLDESLIKTVGGSVKVSFEIGPGERVFLFVTGWLNSDESSAKGDYALSVSTDTGPSGTDCATGIDVTGGGSWGASTASGVDDYAGSSGCGAQPSGADRVYAIDSSAARTYTLMLDTTSGNPGNQFMNLGLFVMSDCGSQACVPLTPLGFIGGTFTATPGTAYSVVVKGDMSSDNNYILHVNPGN